jgi:hypothetical protein
MPLLAQFKDSFRFVLALSRLLVRIPPASGNVPRRGDRLPPLSAESGGGSSPARPRMPQLRNPRYDQQSFSGGPEPHNCRA